MSVMASDVFLWHSMGAPVRIKLVKLTFITRCMPWWADCNLNPLPQKPFSISANLFASRFSWSLESLLVSTKLEMISLTFQKFFLPFLDAIWLQLKNIMVFRRTALSNYSLTDRSWHQIPVLSVQRWRHTDMAVPVAAVKCLIDLALASLDGAPTTLHMAAWRRQWFYVPTYHEHSDITIKTRAGWLLISRQTFIKHLFYATLPRDTGTPTLALELSLQRGEGSF